jgi:hypothetical protein
MGRRWKWLLWKWTGRWTALSRISPEGQFQVRRAGSRSDRLLIGPVYQAPPPFQYCLVPTKKAERFHLLFPSASKSKARHFHAIKWTLESCSNWTKCVKREDPSRCGTRHEHYTKLAISLAIVRHTCNIKRVPDPHAMDPFMGSGGNPCLYTKFRLVLSISLRQLCHRGKRPSFLWTGC